ncbi:MAG: PorP/SprF family type IX secretion system membrane protein [Bacteroidetes bacterium]|nr:PorP/SprF family type IX secretion system membrane protein [Bacteroidota bacterium]
MIKLFTLRTSAFAIFLAVGISSMAQDIHFSQFMQSPLTVNPALAGTTVWIRGTAQYRSQWSAVTVPYSTMGASFDIKSKKRWFKVKNMTEKYRQNGENGFGWGLNVFNDRAGDGHMGTLQFNGSLAYQIFVGQKGMLALGFQGGLMQRSIDFSQLHWGNQYDATSSTGYNSSFDPKENLSNAHFIVPDLSTGGIYTYKKSERYASAGDQMDFTIGAALFHVNQPKYSFLGTGEHLYMRTVIHGNATIGIPNSRLAIAPGIMVAKQGPNQEIFVGSLFKYSLKEDSKYTGFVKGASISAGGFFRAKDAFVAMMMFDFSSYGIGLSYDINVSGLKAVSTGRGGFEISLHFLNPAPYIYSQASFNK